MNKARFRNDWWHTGDLGRRSPDGTLTFIGPMGRMIKSGAENVYSAEVERCLLLHPAVGEVAVIGIPDDLWGQSIKALVVVKANMAVTNDELLQHCRTHLAAYKKPRSLVFLKEALPRTGGGAIDYARIDAQHGGEYPGHGK
jgi:long-chain acyl-CoA synthetase